MAIGEMPVLIFYINKTGYQYQTTFQMFFSKGQEMDSFINDGHYAYKIIKIISRWVSLEVEYENSRFGVYIH
jgi:hypothetical protein